MLPADPDFRFSLLAPPYDGLMAVHSPGAIPEGPASLRGAGLIWVINRKTRAPDFEAAAARPPGLPLVVILPSAEEMRRTPDLLSLVDRCRPHSILPFQPGTTVGELSRVLARPPADLATEVVDYLGWRGVELDQETRRLVRRTLELASELQTIAALSRALYVSRRVLGRRFLERGLPVPSHWLHLGRLLRVAIQLQHTDDTLFAIAVRHGYPDGFALSNQMERLLGVRPSAVRARLGWEWIIEAWMQREAERGAAWRPVRSGEGGEVALALE